MSKKKETSDERRASLTGSIFAAAQRPQASGPRRAESPSIVGAALGAHSEGLSTEVKRLRAERDGAVASGQMLIEIAPDDIRDALPRDRIEAAFVDAGFEALRESIERDGQLIPITVRRNDDGGFEIAAGRRRLEACRQLGRSVLARVQDLDDSEMLQLQFEENEQRADISSFERARWYQAVQAQFSLSTPELARRFKVSQPMIVKYLKLARLPDAIVTVLDDARELSLGDSEKLHKALESASPARLARQAGAARGEGTKAQIRAMLKDGKPRAKSASQAGVEVRKGKRAIASISVSGRKLSVSLATSIDGDAEKRLLDDLSDLLRKHL